MPEGDTVWLAAQRLNAGLAGETLTATDFRLPQLATADLTGQTVTDVISRGKHLLLRTDADLTLHSHLRMDGAWHLYSAGARWTGGAGHQIRVVLETAPRTAVGYRIHDVAVVPTAAESTLVGHLGPDLLGLDWDLDEAVRRITEQPDREIGPALLDQRNLAGIGNLYKAETLFLRGITPWTRVADVDDLPALLRLAQRLLEANKHHWAQATTGDTRKGRNHWVFERPRQPCRRCGDPIAVAEQGEPGAPEQARLTYWCPHCQKGPAPAVDIRPARSPR